MRITTGFILLIFFILVLFSCSGTDNPSPDPIPETLENSLSFDNLIIPINQASLIKLGQRIDSAYNNYDLEMSGKLHGENYLFRIELYSFITNQKNPVFTPGTIKYTIQDLFSGMSFAESAWVFVGNSTEGTLADRGEIILEKNGNNYTFKATLFSGNKPINVDYRAGFDIFTIP